MGKYLAKIGLEMHCEVSETFTKVFSAAENSYQEYPNCNVSPVDMAFPGTLPVVNIEAVKKSILMAKAFNCDVPEYLCFDRKNYYYPDLPKGYQITQLNYPIGINGKVKIELDGEEKEILIQDIHLEEDTANLEHYDKVSLINYNRAGVPLLELVTEPCINSKEEAIAFLETVCQIYRYCGVSEADTKKGQIRCDVNVSIMDEGSNELGTKVEIKGVNSFANVAKVIEYEINRQSELKDLGRYDEVEQETRRWDEETNSTIRMRSKVDAIDYKFFVEPNIPKFKISKKWVEEIEKEIPMLAMDRKKIYVGKYGLSSYDAGVLVKERSISDYFEECLKLGMDAKTAANWVTVQVIAYLNKYNIEVKDFYLKPVYLNQIISELAKGTISSKQAKEIFTKSLEENKEPKNFISKDNAQISDIKVLEEIIDNILANNQSQIEAYKNGRTNLFDYFIGQVMKETRGKANPSMAKEILKNKLDN